MSQTIVKKKKMASQNSLDITDTGGTFWTHSFLWKHGAQLCVARPIGCQQSALYLHWEELAFFCLLCERNPNLFLLPYLSIWNPSANPNINKVAMVFYDYLKNLSQVRLEYCQGKALRSHSAQHTFPTFFLPVSCTPNATSGHTKLAFL